MTKKIIRKKITSSVEILTELHPILRQIFLNRGIVSSTEIERNLIELIPFHKLLNIEKAVEILYEMLVLQKRILIIGDFDADGATSSVLAVSALKAFGAHHVHYLVPNRFEYGYGLTPEIVMIAKQWQPDLIITVDNGISSCAGVTYAKEHNIKVIITDHHLPGTEIPIADAIVNPNLAHDPFESKNLAGVGVIFYVMLAFRSLLREKNWFSLQDIAEVNMADFLDLVALGTVADVVPLDKNNRILVHQGLIRIQNGNCRMGIKALLHIANRDAKALSAGDLAFAIGPRLNAAGRLDDMSLGIECLLAENFSSALEKAKVLDELNQERRFIENDMHLQALKELEKIGLDKKNNLPMALCLYDPEWHQGVIGILAGRIKDRFHRPAVVFAKANEEEIKGSARSINGLHIRDVLDAVATKNPGLIVKFGGHAMAAGLTLALKDYLIFTEALTKEIANHIDENQLLPIIYSDGELQHEDFSLELAQAIRNAGPWGQAFPEPIFDGEFELLEQRLVGGKHLKMTLKQQKKLLEAIAFNIDLQRWPNHRCNKINIAYKLDVNEFRGIKNIQLVVEHLEEA